MGGVTGSGGLFINDVVTHVTKGDIGVISAIINNRAAVWWDHRDPSWPLLSDLTLVVE